MRMEFIFFIIISLAYAITITYSAVNDVKFRSINAFMFVPVFLIDSLFYYFTGSFFIIAVFVFIFVISFMRTSMPLYLIMSVIAIFLSFLFLKNPQVFLGIFISGLVLALGYREELFGIGDIKAIIMAIYPFMILKAPFGLQLLPYPIAFLLYTAIFSSAFIPYVYIFAWRNHLKTRNFNIEYDENIYKKYGNKFKIIKYGEESYMSYRIPFLVPVAAAFFIALFIP